MSPGFVMVVVGLALLFFSVPLYVIIGALTALGYVLFSDLATQYQVVVDGAVMLSNIPEALSHVTLMESARELTDKPPLLAIPFFVLSGAIMSHGAIATRLVNVARATFAFVPGGLGISTVAACMFFAAISGSSPVTVITIGGVMYPALIAAGYKDNFSTGLVTSAGTLGILIPPSIPMIVYAIFASGSQIIQVEDLFLAGLGPGMVIGTLLGSYCLWSGWRKGERFTKPDLGAVWVALVEGFWACMLPVVILGGIYSGMFTATEAAAVSVVYALVVELFIHRELTLPKLPAVFGEASLLMGSLLVIFAMAVGLNHLLSDLQIPEQAANWIMSFELDPMTFMLVLNGFLLVVGCLMDIMSAIMILVPLLAPLAALCGIDPIHLGIVFIVNLELGYLTPPMGLNLFVSSSIFEKSLGEVIKSVIPFTGLLLVAVLIVTYVPTVSLGPVNALSGKDFYVPFPDGDSCAAPPKSGDGEMLDDDDDDDDAPKGKSSGAKSIGDLMKSTKGFDDAFDDDDDDDDEADGADKRPKSIGELMKSTKGFDDAFDEDDEEDEDEDEEPKVEDKTPKSIGELMKSTKGFDEAFEEDDEDEAEEGSKAPTPPAAAPAEATPTP